MVDVPSLVADDDVVVLLTYGVVEDHEVVYQNLVHAPNRFERMEIVFGTLAFDVGRLVRQERARGVHRLSPRTQNARHGMLREPFDLQVRVQCAKFGRDGGVALRVTEPDRRRDEQRALLLTGTRRRFGRGAHEVANRHVHQYRYARLRQVPASSDNAVFTAGRIGELLPAIRGDDVVGIAVQHQYGTPNARG